MPLGKQGDHLSKSSFLAKILFASSTLATQVCFWSTVSPNNLVLVTKLNTEFPKYTGVTGPIGVPFVKRMTLLLLGWGVNPLFRHQL